jgi:hypothetical protein
MDYIVVSTSKCDYQAWQLKLLYWSIKKSKQKGKLILLVSSDELHAGENPDFNFPSDVTIIEQPDWAWKWKTENDDWWGGIPNKYKAVEWLCDNNYFKDEDKLLFLDPDMVFKTPIDVEIDDNQVIGQNFIHFTHLADWKQYDSNDGIMYPFALKFSTLKKISKDYTNFCEQMRKQTGKWESEMWGLDYALKENNIDIKLIEDWGTCTEWNRNNDRDIIGNLIHYPNEILDENGNRMFFKQDYTYTPNQKILLNTTKNKLDNLLLTDVDQQRTDYLYYLKYNFDSIFKFYDGSKGYLIFRPWPGGFNNIRMSMELAVCIAYLTNRTLVLTPKYNMYLLEGESGMDTFFDTFDLGIKSITFDDFSSLKNIPNNWDGVRTISKVLDYDAVANVMNFERIPPPTKFLKGRKYINDKDYFTDEECIFLDGNLLGNSYQTIYTCLDDEIKKLVAKYVKYKPEIFDLAWQFINYLEDKSYYSIHIRRNDFQYKDLFISCEQILDNIKDTIPFGSKLYVATDQNDRSFFAPLAEHYTLFFYDDIRSKLKIYDEFDVNYIPIIEQLICTRSIKFIGNKLSTLSSYIYRLRGYMNDIEDKNYYLNTEKYNPELQEVLTTDNSYIANWAREYKDAWHWYKGRVFVSVASYCDSRIYDTLKSIYSEACDETRVFVGLHLQDTQEVYDEVLKLNYPNLRIKFTLKENAKGVVWARNKIREELYQGEEYFLQIDSHSRVKKNWDAILINQYNSIEQPKVVITTYPNHFDMPDPEKKYLNLPYNTPLRIKQFIHPEDPIDNRCRAENLPSLNDYEVKETRWGAAGFFFTQKWWVEEVTMPDEMAFIGEEDHLTFLSYLKGWNLFVPSEATVWHNYEYRLAEDEKPYREHNNSYLITDHSVELVNKMLFKSGYERTIEQAEEYFNFKFKRPEKPNTIFVAIASYLDYEIKYTILDCINKAKHPENLHFSVCLQYDENEETNESCIDDLIKKYNIKVVKYHHTQSEGGCWARNQAQLAYNDEKYSLQIDSHTRLLQNWDEIAISDYEKLKQNGNKPLLSFLPPSYFRKDELGIDYNFTHIEEPDKIHIPKFNHITAEYWPHHDGYSNEIRTNGDNLSVKILYGGFVFGDGNWVKNIIQDPEHYYTGEEFALTIRSFTNGYDIFTPSKILAWHRCHYNPLKKHYTNNSQEVGDAKHRHAMERLRKLIEGGDLGVYGLGSVRTIEDYGNFAGIDFKNKVLK